jgi:hypothetical protein
MTSTHRWLADEAKDTRRLVLFPCLRQNPAGVRHERIPKLEEDVGVAPPVFLGKPSGEVRPESLPALFSPTAFMCTVVYVV